MRKKLQAGARAIAENPRVRHSVAQMKPHKSVWGFLGVVLFFIVPEIVAFVWGADITDHAHAQLLLVPAEPLASWYASLIWLFEDGGSWINLVIGFALLIWLFF